MIIRKKATCFLGLISFYFLLFSAASVAMPSSDTDLCVTDDELKQAQKQINIKLKYKLLKEKIPFFTLEKFIDLKNGCVTEAIKDLLDLTGVHPKSYSLEDVEDAVQGRVDPSQVWLRQPGKERWEIEKSLFNEEVAKNIVTVIFEDLGLKQEVKYESSFSDSANRGKEQIQGFLVLGSSLRDMRDRINYMTKFLQSHPTFPIYLLGGDRQLSLELGETQQAIFDKNQLLRYGYKFPNPLPIISNEQDLITIIADQAIELPYQKNIIHLHTNKVVGSRRATTADTLATFFGQKELKKGHYVAISSAPFVMYQQLVINRFMVQHKLDGLYTIQAVGPKVSSKYDQMPTVKKAAILLDNLARMFYELRKISEMVEK